MFNISLFCCVHSASSLWVFPAGVQYVFDTTLAAGFSILESQKEFIQRYRRRHHDSHALPMFTSSCPGKLSSLLCLPHTPPTLYCCFFFSSFFQTPTPLYWFVSVIIICAGVCLSFKISLFCKSPGSFLSEFLCVCWTWGFRGAESCWGKIGSSSCTTPFIRDRTLELFWSSIAAIHVHADTQVFILWGLTLAMEEGFARLQVRNDQ